MAEERHQIFEDIRTDALKTTASFFTRWSILCGGSFALIIPFVQSIKGSTMAIWALGIGELGLLTSLALALFGLYIVMRATHERIKQKLESNNKFWKYFESTEEVSVYCCVTYGIAILALLYFLNSNLPF